jgi:ribosome-binding protein aMBF1 (putative translation factor)
MATPNKNLKRSRPPLTTEEQIGRLRSEVARLQSVIRTLKGAPKDAVPKTRSHRTSKGHTLGKSTVPALPSADADGNYPAQETLRAILARQIIRRREAVGWTQAELAGRAGVRQETVSRIETGRHAPNISTVDKLDRALQEAGV